MCMFIQITVCSIQWLQRVVETGNWKASLPPSSEYCFLQWQRSVKTWWLSTHNILQAFLPQAFFQRVGERGLSIETPIHFVWNQRYILIKQTLYNHILCWCIPSLTELYQNCTSFIKQMIKGARASNGEMNFKPKFRGQTTHKVTGGTVWYVNGSFNPRHQIWCWLSLK